MTTTKQAFRAVYSKARALRKDRTFESAFWLTERAVGAVLDETGEHYHPFVTAQDAVLWALHWRFFEPVNVPPKGLSERHMCFNLTPEGSTVWWERKLPG